MWINKNRINIFFCSLVSLCFAIVCYRAICIDITHDEAFSFFLIKTGNLKALATTANTHWLNSLFMKLVYLLGFDQVYLLRLYSVLSFLVYAWFVYRFLSLFKSTAARILFIMLLICNPMVLEFFSLARGYAISLAFFMGVAFYALQFLKDSRQQRHLRKALFFAVLSILGNYTALYPIVAIFLFLLLIYRNDFIPIFSQKNNLRMLILFSLTLIGAMANMLLIKYISNDLQYGADHSFLFETLNSLFLYIAFQPIPNSLGDLNYFVSGWSVLIVLFAISALILAIKQKNRFLAFGPVLFLATWFFYLLSHLLFSTPYPLARTTLILLPALVFMVVFWMDSLRDKKWLSSSLSLAISIVLLFFTFSSFSLKHTLEWRNQADAELVFENILHQNSVVKSRPSILSDEPCYAVWKNYYSQINPQKYAFEYAVLDKTKPIDSTDFISRLVGKDFFIISKKYEQPYYKNLPQLKQLKYYPNSETWVYKVTDSQ
jgi:hypothetical protein